MTEVRRSFTAEFKLAAIRLLTDSKLSLAEAARRLHIGENMLRRWRDDYQKRGPQAFPGNPDSASAAPRRGSTTTPLQALSLWNNSFSLRMADALAERVGDGPAEERVRRVWQLVYQREPTADETAAASKLATQRGMKALCRALLNSNEIRRGRMKRPRRGLGPRRPLILPPGRELRARFAILLSYGCRASAGGAGSR